MLNNHRRRVAITGIGMVTPLGNDTASTWNGILDGSSGCAEIRSFDASGFPTRIAAEVSGFRPQDHIEERKVLKYTVSVHIAFALVAAEEAIRDAGIRPTPATAERWGLVNGSGMMTTGFEFLARFQKEFAARRRPRPRPIGPRRRALHLRDRFRAAPCRRRSRALGAAIRDPRLLQQRAHRVCLRRSGTGPGTARDPQRRCGLRARGGV